MNVFLPSVISFASFTNNDIYSVSSKSIRCIEKSGAQTNWANQVLFAADYSEILEVF
jgi:hypothetical protein